MNLEKLQHSFLDFINNNKQNPELFDLIASDYPQDLLKIYQRNVKFNLQGAIYTHFTSLCKHLDENKLEKITFECISQYPSQSGNLDDYMQFFLEYIEDNVDDATTLDLAKLDFYYWRLYSKKDVSYTDQHKFQSIPPKSLSSAKFILNPDIEFIKLHNNNSLILWGELNDNKFYKNLNLHHEITMFIVFKYQLDVVFIPINDSESFFLKKLLEKKSLEDVYDSLLKAYPDCKFDEMINKFISNNTICSFTIS